MVESCHQFQHHSPLVLQSCTSCTLARPIVYSRAFLGRSVAQSCTFRVPQIRGTQ